MNRLLGLTDNHTSYGKVYYDERRIMQNNVMLLITSEAVGVTCTFSCAASVLDSK